MLHVHRSEGTLLSRGQAARELGALLAVPPADPFTPDVVAVESAGVQRWLSQAVAAEQGVCANVEFPRPSRLLAEVLAGASGVPVEADPWRPARLAWHVLRAIDAAGDDPALAPVASYVAGEERSGRRMATALRVAGLLASYSRHRPELLVGWADDRETGVPPDLRWQPRLFRRVREAVGVPSPAERVEAACAALAERPDLVDLPERVVVFRPDRLSESDRRLLDALAGHREVHLWEAERRVSFEPGLTSAAIQVHSCHGRARQVEVLRDALLGLLEDDPTLELRDIVVMAPDAATFAPLLSAAFDDVGGTHPGQVLRTRLADGSVRETDGIAGLLSRLVSLARGRVTVSDVLDLAALPVVRERFGFGDDELELVASWAEGAGVRWGVDVSSRAAYALGRYPQGTWRAGLDRLLLGVAMDAEELRLVGGVLPVDDVDSGDIDLAGRLAELVDRLDGVLTGFASEQPLTAWVETVEDALDGLARLSYDESWQRGRVTRHLARLVESAGDLADTVSLDLADVTVLLADVLDGTPVRSGFRSGRITVTSLAPLRGVPHRVVAVLGLDDGEFPRAGRASGDDLVGRMPRPGDPDRGRDDRALLMDAIASASEHVLLLYGGHDERTGAARPPAAPLGEIVDALSSTPPVVEHPLQPFDPRAYAPGELAPDTPFGFDPVGLAGARALLGERQPVPPFLSRPVTTPALDTVDLDLLVRFLDHPVKGFLRQGLEIVVPDDEEEAGIELPVELTGLDEWKLGDRLLRAGIDDTPYHTVVAAEVARGSLPPGMLGKAAFDKVMQGVGALLEGTSEIRAGVAQRMDVDVELPSGRRLVGSLREVYGDHLVRLEYSRFKPKHRLAAWVHLLAVTAQDSGRGWHATVAGRGRRPGAIERTTFKGVLPDRARYLLDDLVDLMRSGLAEPLPLFDTPSATYAATRHDGRPVGVAMLRAAGDWTSRFGPALDPAHQLVWGSATFEEIAAGRGGQGDSTEPTRFGALARRVWEPVLQQEAR